MYWGDFLEKLKQFLGRGSKMHCLFLKNMYNQFIITTIIIIIIIIIII